uniref:DUF1003 domain-containing protein n=1 Tax=Gongylonema pulchrum TaxID=637853 RepID=A0A183D4C6_9BILA
LERVATFSIGAVVIMLQLSLTIFLAIINMIVNAVVSGRERVQTVTASAANAPAAARQMVSNLSDKVHDVSRASTEKVGQQAGRFLDHANKMAESALGVAPETSSVERTLAERLTDLGYRISQNLKNRAHGDVIDTVYADMHGIMERLSNSLSLVDMVRQQKSWAAGKFGTLQTSLADLKESLEKEADRLKSNPEEALMNYMRQNSALLSSQINTLRESSGQVKNPTSYLSLKVVRCSNTNRNGSCSHSQ